MKLIHITDFHLVAPTSSLWGLKPHERVDRCLADIAQWHSDADFCVISGDLADRGERDAYRWLAERLKRFPLKTFLMMGNHDDRRLLLKSFPDLPVDNEGFVQFTHRVDMGVFLFLDTFKGGTSAGQYCEKRHAWLAEQLDAAGDAHVWIFMHHPPFDIGIPYLDRIKLEESDAFAETVASRSNIRHIFFGHVHRAAFINWRGIPCTCLPATSHQVPLTRESVGTNYSYEPVMYGVVHIEDDRTIVHFDACLDRAAADMTPSPAK